MPTGAVRDISKLYNEQGKLSEGDYLELTRMSRRMAEFTDGYIEVLPMPTLKHQLILQCLHSLLFTFVNARQLGIAIFSPLRVRCGDAKYREPDIVFMLSQNRHRAMNEYWEGADLVMEVISESDPDRDWIQKRDDYAQANIPEYWIVDPRTETITVLSLRDGTYVETGTFGRGDSAKSVLLEGFHADVASVFNAANS
jgi:Uma2 family endonuclease